MNNLANEKSAYLKHAADQKVNWYPWSEDAFKRAEVEDKPLFLSSGAVWCHWCHVMAKESFFDDEIAGILNQNFVCIKLDRDERPSIDRRYQLAVSAMGGGGGWPLTVFLTPDKKPFYGGTYFPPEDRFGRPGLKKLLTSISTLYRDKRTEVTEYSDKVIEILKSDPLNSGEISENRLDEAASQMLSTFDPHHGGFGNAPKFPMHGAMDFLLNRYVLTGNVQIKECIQKTLDAMARGGIHDHIGGGFHRYSTDDAWIVPHFEKMAEDNAWLLRIYLNAYSVFGDATYRGVAEGIIQFTLNELTDPNSGFYSSQDADITPDDEGGYFTWSDDEFRKILNDEQYHILSDHFLGDAGVMHHNKSRMVLYINKSSAEIAEATGRDPTDVNEIIRNGTEILLNERNRRERPFIDKTLYTSINGMYISALLKASRILDKDHLKDVALRSLDNIMHVNMKDGMLYHTDGIEALLDDYVYLADALVAAYEAVGLISYLDAADRTMETCITKFWDDDEGGFFDSDDHMLGVKLKGVQDVPYPAANSLCIIVMLKLYMMTGKMDYYHYAETALKAFSSTVSEMGIHAGFYYSALDAFYNSVNITVHADPQSELALACRSVFVPHLNIRYGDDRDHVTVCFRNRCFEPIGDAGELEEFLQKSKYSRTT